MSPESESAAFWTACGRQFAADDRFCARCGATGSFLILNWSGYPTVGGVPKPNGPFRLIEGADYQSARDAALTANAADPSLSGLQLHEIKPVKFGGSPTDLGNKFPLTQAEHTPYTNWWNKLQRCLEAA